MSLSAPPSSTLPAGVSLVNRVNRLRTARGEKILAGVTGLNLVLLPWAFGGVDVPSQLVAALLGAVALLIALRPRRGRAALDATATTPWTTLRRFPIFWAGLALFGYVLLQALNPAWVYHDSQQEWWLEPEAFARWLPAGMTVPFAEGGPLRALLLWFSPWATTCALWIGLTRRTTVVALLNVIAANGFLLAAFGLVQLAAGVGDAYSVRHTPSADIFASFIYRNHAAGYFLLVAAVAVALALDGLWRRRRSATAPHGPAILHFLFAITALTAVVLTFSLGGLGLLAASWGLLFVLTGGRFRRALAGTRVKWPAVIMALAIIGLVGGLAVLSGSEPLREHLRAKFNGGAGQSLRTRWLAAKQGVEMFRDRPLLGWGAGCFRYGFTKYQRREIEIAGTGLARHFWEHVHNDWLEGLIELGVVGAIPVVFAIACWVRWLARARFWREPALLWGVGGVATLALYGWFDFPFQNPAVLLTAAGVLCLVTRWSEFSARETQPAPASPRRNPAAGRIIPSSSLHSHDLPA